MMPSNTELKPTYLARHGETESNCDRRYAGRNNEGLNARGRGQVLALARLLFDKGIEAIWTSPVPRAVESAEIVSQELRIPLQEDARLAEMLMGPWKGLTEAEVEHAYPREYHLWNTVPASVAIEGRETLKLLTSRVLAAVDDAAQSIRPVLLMTHVAPMRVVALSTLDLDLNNYKRLAIPNAACIMVDRDRGEVHRLPHLTSVRTELDQAGIHLEAGPVC